MVARRQYPELPDLTPTQVRAWRERLSLTQKEAAERLGVAVSQYQSYERGQYVSHTGPRPAPPPLTVRLAMSALEAELPPVS